jgi:hypothetical protein
VLFFSSLSIIDALDDMSHVSIIDALDDMSHVSIIDAFDDMSHVSIIDAFDDMSISNDGNINNHRILAPLTDTDSVLITGIRQPISFAYDSKNGNIFILQKKGIVRLCKTWICNTPPSILDFSRTVSSFGDHGATSILYSESFDSSYLYITYMKLNPIWGYDCADSGALNGRAKEDVFGCQIFGRLSRWKVNEDGYIISHEEVILDTETDQKACVQFPTHSTPTCVVKGADGDYFLGMGDGAAYSQLDDGGLGGNLCNDDVPYLGALRAQNPTQFNGKIIRISGSTFEASIESIGHRNPFRLTVDDEKLYATETGWYTAEEINLIEPGNNYGWPCFEGIDPTPEYSELSFCKTVNTSFTPPVFSYLHPIVVAQMVASISGIAVLDKFMYFADYSIGTVSRIDKTTFDKDKIETMMTESFVCELKRVNDVILYVDILKGIIGKVPSFPIGTLSLSETYPLPECEIVSLNTEWDSFTGYPAFSAKTNIDGREGTTWLWSVALFYNFRSNDCDYTFLFSNAALGGGLTFPAPYLPPGIQGTLEISLEVNTEKGKHAGIAAAKSQFFLGTRGSELNTCTGVRTQSHLEGAPSDVFFQEGDGVPIITGVAQLNVKANLPHAPEPGTLLLLEPVVSIPSVAQFKIWRTLPVFPWTPFAENDPWVPLNKGSSYVYSLSDDLSTSSLLFAAVPILSSKSALANATFTWRAYILSCNLIPSCGWAFITEKTTARPWLFLQPPSIKLPEDNSGVSLLIEAIATTSSNTRTVAQQIFIPFSSTIGSQTAPVCDCITSYKSHEISLSGTTIPAGTYLYEEAPIFAAFSESLTPFTNYDESFFTVTPHPSAQPQPSSTNTASVVNGNGGITSAVSDNAGSTNIFTSPAFIGGMAAGAVVVAIIALIVVVIHKTAPSQVPINVATTSIRPIPMSQKPSNVEQVTEARPMSRVIRTPASSDFAVAPRARPGILSPVGAPATKAV